MTKKMIKLLGFFAIIGIILIIQNIYAVRLEEMSAPLIHNLQQDESFIHTMKLISNFGSKKMKDVFFLFTLSFCNIYHSFIFALVCFSSMLVSSWLKLILQEPRPFWVYDTVSAIECESGYGYPSNHVLSTVPAFFIFFDIIYYRYEVDKRVNGKLFYWVGIVIVGFLCCSIGFSRMVLGVHSVDQVVFGLIMGFACYYFYFYIIDYDLTNFQNFLDIFNKRVGFAKFMSILIGLYILYLLNSTILPIEYKPEWTEGILNRCGKLPFFTPFYKCVMDSGDYLIIIGMNFGILYDVKFNFVKRKDFKSEYTVKYLCDNYGQSASEEHARIGSWNRVPVYIGVVRIIIFYILFFSILALISSLQPLFEYNMISNYLLSKVFALPLAGFSVFAFKNKICDALCLT